MANQYRRRLDLSTTKRIKPSDIITESIDGGSEILEPALDMESFEYQPPEDADRDKFDVFIEKTISPSEETSSDNTGRPKLNLKSKSKKSRVKPDFLDLDGDDDKEEPMVKAVDEAKPKETKKEVKEKTTEEVKEEVLETPPDRILGAIEHQLSSMAKLGSNSAPKSKSISEQKIDILEGQVRDMRRMILEMSNMPTQNTIVGSLGAGSPGSGEVNFLKLDDVDGSSFDKGTESQIMVWDTTTQKFTPIPLVSSSVDTNDVSTELQGFYGLRSGYYYASGITPTTQIEASDVDTWLDVNFTIDPEGLHDNRTTAMKEASGVGHIGAGTTADPITFLLDGLNSHSTVNFNSALSFLPEIDEGQLEVRLNFTRNSTSVAPNFVIADIAANMDQGASIEYTTQTQIPFFCDSTLSTNAPGDAGQFTFQVRSTVPGTLNLRALTLYISQ